MIVKHCKRHNRTVSIPPGAQNARRQWDRLSRLYLLIEDDKGNIGVGEASPLPGHSMETVSDCKSVLDSQCPSLKEASIETPDDILHFTAAMPTIAPAARFALETALLDLLARNRNIPLWQLFVAQTNPILVNALLPADNFEEMAHKFYNSGIRVFKLKVGRHNNFQREVDQIKWLRDTFGDTINIRLDANGAFAGRKLSHKLAELSRFNPEYIEEPAPLTALLPQKLPIPYAFDESLVHIKNPEAINAHPSCEALILKPSLLGGFFRVLQLAKVAKAYARKAIVTHMFESLPGFIAAVHLAYAVQCREACGLYPHNGLHNDMLNKFCALDGATLTLKEHPGLGITRDDLAFIAGFQ